MYLVSIYFDEKTNNRIKNYMKEVVKSSGNAFMTENHVPPHITISAFETLEEENAKKALDDTVTGISQGEIQWVTVGTFPTVIFIQPVLNAYLHKISTKVYEAVKVLPDTSVHKYYRPFAWLPHATIGKQLSKEELLQAFDALQKSFGIFESKVVRMELAKKNPYMGITGMITFL